MVESGPSEIAESHAAACDGDHPPDCPILHDLETVGTIMSSDLQ